jgi:hypothetical protein
MEELIINNEKDELTILSDNKSFIHFKMIDSIEKSFKDDIDTMEIIRIVNNYRGYTMVLKVEKGKWLDSLEKSLSYFEEIENYKVCQEIKTLMGEIKKQ